MKSPEIIVTGRGPELAGTRFTVYDVVPMWRKGRHPAYIGAVLGLCDEEVATLIQYIEEHTEEVLRHDDEIERRIARGNPPEVEAKLQAAHVKVLALREELLRKRQETNGESHPQ